ncbi:MAG: hypothetical protein OHK0017_12540 [Patescibacteria group bacterium]
MIQYIKENSNNARLISSFFREKYTDQSLATVNVLDLCCGVYVHDGINYDKYNEIYQPEVAQSLTQLGFKVTGVDQRSNDREVSYNHRTDIDIWQDKLIEQLKGEWNILVFLRSWDTPELLLKMQQLSGERDLDKLTEKLAQHFLPLFRQLLKTGNWFVTSEIYSRLDSNGHGLANTEKILNRYGFELVHHANGLYFTKAH